MAVCGGAALLGAVAITWLHDPPQDRPGAPAPFDWLVSHSVDVDLVEADPTRPNVVLAASRTALHEETDVLALLAAQAALDPEALARVVRSLGTAIVERDQESVRLLALKALRGGERAPAGLVRAADFLDATGMDGQALQWAVEAALQVFGTEEAALRALLVLERLAEPGSWAPHVLGALSLHVQPGSALLDHLLGLTDTWRQSEIRQAAIQCLATMEVPVQGRLIGILEDEDPVIRVATLDALLESDGQLSPDLLGSMLAEEDEPAVRDQWMASMGRHLDAANLGVLARSGDLRNQAEMDRLMSESVLAGRANDLWRELGWSADERIQEGLLGSLAKVHALHQQPDEVTLEALERLTRAGASPFIRGFALEQAIGFGGGSASLQRDLLVQGLAEDPAWFTWAAQSWMARHGRASEVVEALQWALEDASQEPQVLRQVQETLDALADN